LRIEPRHIYGLQALPDVHRDPFDGQRPAIGHRIMIAQAIVEDLSLVSADLMFERYPVRLLW
jgi:PIN domain nuclease of toxin-antitoxin system